jgi:YHS domain-containing protein
MKNHSKLFAAAAAALLLSAPAFAQGHGDHAQGGHCPHHQATETAVSQALALLGQAKAQNGDQAKATVEKARLQLTEAQKHMDACEKMCEVKMGEGHGDHGGHAGHAGHAGHGAAAATAGAAKAELVTDPVCGMKIDPKTAAGKSVYAGKTYYFCSKNEKVAFDKDPETYLKQD